MTPNRRMIAPVVLFVIAFVLGVMCSPWVATVLMIDTRAPVRAPHYMAPTIEKEGNQSSEVTTEFKFQTIVKRKSSLLTLFTSWPNWSWQQQVFNNTLHNWRLLFPFNVTAVLFTNNLTVGQVARDLNWTVLPIRASISGDDGPPTIPMMFKQAREAIYSQMYGFVNGDILFDDSIVDTVKIVLNSTLLTAENSPPVMITGRRINVNNITVVDALSWSSLRNRSKTGKLHIFTSEDYFITNRDYPWEQYPPIAIGQRGYDNWLVLRGNQLSHNLVDGSYGVLAVHQNIKDPASVRKLKSFFEYNIDLLRKKFGKINYDAGQTVCCQFETVRNSSGLTVLRIRDKFPQACTVVKVNSTEHA